MITRNSSPFFSHSPMTGDGFGMSSPPGGAEAGFEAMDTSASSSLPKQSHPSAVGTKSTMYKHSAVPINPQRLKHI